MTDAPSATCQLVIRDDKKLWELACEHPGAGYGLWSNDAKFAPRGTVEFDANLIRQFLVFSAAILALRDGTGHGRPSPSAGAHSNDRGADLGVAGSP